MTDLNLDADFRSDDAPAHDVDLAVGLVGRPFENRNLTLAERIQKTRDTLLQTAEITMASSEWQTDTEENHVGHIIAKHLSPTGIIWYGVPIFDIGVCLERGFRMAPICAHIYKMLARRDLPPGCRDLFVKTLLFIDRQKPGQVQWEEVAKVYPGYSIVELDLTKDTLDTSFTEMLRDSIADRSVL